MAFRLNSADRLFSDLPKSGSRAITVSYVHHFRNLTALLPLPLWDRVYQ
jgi:hypothetical protein